ncbi:hypothetical protein Nepgr_019172 [Nepenthes gracilis]|uniref:Uncharacterized protein n=1 Tax=Nepenthes gracilis TaxID=150966 RepID=A0AAD3SWG3_NEPGR|nr:hypothetical protein Nepgr_019172 [Nepenthes gracilis]
MIFGSISLLKSLCSVNFESMEKNCGINDNDSSSECTPQKDDTKSLSVLSAKAMTAEVGYFNGGNSGEGTSVVASCSHGIASSTGDNKTTSNKYAVDADLKTSTIKGDVSRVVEEGFEFKTESSSSNSSHENLSVSCQDKIHEDLEAKSCQNSTNKIISNTAIVDVNGETVGISSKKDEKVKETAEQIESLQLLGLEKTERQEESSPALVLESGDEHQTAANWSPVLYKFDLNDDIKETEAAESVFSNHKLNELEPITVVAKIGVPVGSPRIPLQFDGKLGWRRSAATSAFRLAENKRISDHCNSLNKGQSLSCRGIDLNIAIAADNLATESAHIVLPSELPPKECSVEVSSKQSKRVIFDLNCQSENDDNHPKSVIRGFNLNDKFYAEDTDSDVYPSGQSSQLSRNRVPVGAVDCSKATAKPSTYDCMSPAYWVDLSSMPGLTHVHAQPFLLASPGLFTSGRQMHPVVPLLSQVALPGIYGSTINGSSPPVYSPIILPPLSDQNGVTVVPQTLHLQENTQKLSPSGYTSPRPGFVLSSGVTSSEYKKWGVNTKEVFDPGRNTLFDERMKSVKQVALPPASMKRREPEGGLVSCSFTLDGRARRIT